MTPFPLGRLEPELQRPFPRKALQFPHEFRIGHSKSIVAQSWITPSPESWWFRFESGNPPSLPSLQALAKELTSFPERVARSPLPRLKLAKQPFEGGRLKESARDAQV